MSAALDRHRARAAEILGDMNADIKKAQADMAAHVAASAPPTYATQYNAMQPQAPAAAAASVADSRGTFTSVPTPGAAPAAPKARFSEADIDKLVNDAYAAPISPSSPYYTSPLEVRARPRVASAGVSFELTAKNVAIGLGALAGLGLIALLVRRR